MISIRVRHIALTLAFLSACMFATRPLFASLLLDSGPNYFVVQNDAGGTTGSVVMRMDLFINTYGVLAVNSRIVSISAQPGWTWVIRKPGGVNREVEVLFTQGSKRLTFKALYVPGKTIIDNGTIK